MTCIFRGGWFINPSNNVHIAQSGFTMNSKLILGGVSTVAAIGMFAASPANAVITLFATTSATTPYNFYFKNSAANNTGNTATFYSTSAANSTIAGPASIKFSFVNEGALLDTAVSSVNALFTMSGTVTTAGTIDRRGNVEQDITTGVFSITSVSAIKVGGTTYAAGSVLLSGNFGDAELTGKNTTGNLIADNDTSNGQTDSLVLMSNFLTFAPGAGLDASFNISSAVPALGDLVSGVDSLKSFKAPISAQFSADPIPRANYVPEPTSWALMIAGVGLAGASLRGRRRELTA